MTSRLLPRSEWPRLQHTLLADTWMRLPVDAVVVVVEELGEIVACSALFQAWHQEGTWIDDAHRGKVVAGRHLLKAMREAIKGVGATEVFMMATTPETAALCQKFGPSIHLTADHFAVSTGV